MTRGELILILITGLAGALAVVLVAAGYLVERR